MDDDDARWELDYWVDSDGDHREDPPTDAWDIDRAVFHFSEDGETLHRTAGGPYESLQDFYDQMDYIIDHYKDPDY